MNEQSGCKKHDIENDKGLIQYSPSNIDKADKSASLSSSNTDNACESIPSIKFEDNPQERSDETLPHHETNKSTRNLETKTITHRVVHRTTKSNKAQEQSEKSHYISDTNHLKRDMETANTRNIFHSNPGSSVVAENAVTSTFDSGDIYSDGKRENEITNKIFVKNARRLSIGYGLSGVKKASFNYFTLFSVTTDMLALNNLSAGSGSKCFDPFVINKSKQLDHFPLTEMVDSVTNDGISSLCFPNGIDVRFVPKCALNNAHRVSWIGQATDRYQLHTFTDVGGLKTYGISITVKETLEISPDLSVQYKLLKKKRKAVALISDWWLEIQYRIKSQSMKGGIGSSRLSLHGPMGITDLTTMRKNSFIAIHAMVKQSNLREKRLLRRKNKSKSYEKNIAPIASVSAIRKAAVSYRNMIQNDDKGDICIVEKCYALIGTKLDEHSLLFNALQCLVDSERESKMNFFHRKKDRVVMRHLALSEIQRLQLSSEQSLIEHIFDPNEMEQNFNEENRSYYIHQFSSNGLANIKLPLPLPQYSDYGVAKLFLTFKASTILIVLKLLLLERSILVIGKFLIFEQACRNMFTLIYC